MNDQPPTLNTDIKLISTDNSGDITPVISNFITLGLLAKKFDEQEITIRRALKKLIKQGKLIDGKDFIKDDYINEKNFVYKIDPDKFIELVKQSDITPDNKTDIKLMSLKEKYLQKEAKVKEEGGGQVDITPDNTLISTDISQKEKELIKDQKTDINLISVDNSPELIKVLKDGHQRIEQNTKERIVDLKEINKKFESELKEKNIQIGKHQKAEVMCHREIQDLNRRMGDKDKEIEQANGRVLYLQQQIHLLEKPKENSKEKQPFLKKLFGS